MRRVRTLAIAVALLGAFGAHAADRRAFGPGEQIRYEVSYLGVVAGLAQVTVGWKMQQFGKDVWPLVCVAQTTSVAQVVRVRDRFISYWDPTTNQPLGADFFAEENQFRQRERYTYDAEAGRIHVMRQRPGKPTTEHHFDSPTAPLDLAAAGFAMRSRDLEVGGVHEMPIFTGKRVFTMQAKVEAKETITTRIGEVEVFRVSFNGEFEGKLATKRNMTIYFTADERRVPVRAEADLVLGSLMVEAVSYEPGRTSLE